MSFTYLIEWTKLVFKLPSVSQNYIHMLTKKQNLMKIQVNKITFMQFGDVLFSAEHSSYLGRE